MTHSIQRRRFLVGGAGLLTAGLISNPWLAFAGLTIGIAGLCAATGIFWSIPTGFFRGSAKAAAVFTLINLTGNLSGLIIPPVIGTLRVMTDGFMLRGRCPPRPSHSG